MSRLTESAIEGFSIKLFVRLGYGYIHAPDIASDGNILLPKLMSGAVRVALDKEAA